MARRKQTYAEIMAERDAYKHDLDACKHKLDVITADRVNRQAKNSVFLNLFMRKEYQLQLYKELFPQDTTITADDLELVTLDDSLAIHPYNDFGLLVKGKLIVVTEAQTIWGANTLFRLADSYFDSVMNHLKIRKAYLSSSVVDITDVEVFVLYTGKKDVVQDVLSLNQESFGGEPNNPDFKIRIIHGENKGGIIGEYMGFCQIRDEYVPKAKTPEEKQRAVITTIDLCIQEGCLARYMDEHRSEVENIMMTTVSPDYVKIVSERTQRIKDNIRALRFAGIPDSQIKDAIIRRYDLTPTYAQNFLDDDSDPEDSRPWAL